MTYAAIRIRGTVNVKPDIKKTLQLLNLTRINHCVLLEEKPSIKGMLQVAKDYITWGELEKDALTNLMKSRGKLEGDKPITDDHIKSATSYSTIEHLSKDIVNETIYMAKNFNIEEEVYTVEKTRKVLVEK